MEINDYLYDFFNVDNERSKECAECGEHHLNTGNYCSLQCANESMR